MFVIYILLIPSVASATAQTPETIIYEGKEELLFSTLKIPESHPRISTHTSDAFRDTSNWRGYRGTWEIKDNHLYLTDIEGYFKLSEKELLFADWFSGSLRIVRGKRIHYVHMGFESIFEEDVIIYVDKGIVTNTEIIDNRYIKNLTRAEIEKIVRERRIKDFIRTAVPNAKEAFEEKEYKAAYWLSTSVIAVAILAGEEDALINIDGTTLKTKIETAKTEERSYMERLGRGKDFLKKFQERQLKKDEETTAIIDALINLDDTILKQIIDSNALKQIIDSKALETVSEISARAEKHLSKEELDEAKSKIGTTASFMVR